MSEKKNGCMSAISITHYPDVQQAARKLEELGKKVADPGVISNWRRNSIEFWPVGRVKKVWQSITGLAPTDAIQRTQAIEIFLKKNPTIATSPTAQALLEKINGSDSERTYLDRRGSI